MIAHSSPRAAIRGFTSDPGSSIVHCNGAQMRAHRRDEIIVVKVTGDIDATNIDRFYDYISRFLREAPGLVLDLGDVDFLCARGISVLVRLDTECRSVGTHWAIVCGAFISRLVRLGEPYDTLPIAASEHQALRAIAEQRRARLVAS